MLLALDPAVRTGYALCEPFAERPTKMTVGSWQMGSGSHFDRATELANHLSALLRANPYIEAAAVELPMSAPPARKRRATRGQLWEANDLAAQGSLSTQNLLWALHGAIAGTLAAHGIPTLTVSPKTWRKAVFGNGNIRGADSKRRSKETLLGWGVKARNQDAAEAGMIAVWLNTRMGRLRLEQKTIAATPAA